MPGICGCVTTLPQEAAAAKVKKMVNTLLDEEHSAIQVWTEQSQGVYVAWAAPRKLCANQSGYRGEDDGAVLILSGEEYSGTAQNAKENSRLLDERGPSYIISRYKAEGSFPAQLNGRFHGLFVDPDGGKTVVFNDRFGMRRLYYYESGDTFYFAAEAKAILAVCPELRRLNYRSFGEYVSCGAVLENRTLFEEIRILPQGSAWVFRNGSLEKKASYFHPQEWEEQEALDPETYYSELRNVFSANLGRYFGGSQRIGMSLTGGLDTRIILATQHPLPGSLPCYTFGSMYRDNEDVRIARRVAKACDQRHEVLIAGEEFLSQFSRYAERTVYLSDGCADVSRSPDLYLNEKARDIAPVRMTGNYGGEILRGIVTFKPADPVDGLYCPDFVSLINDAAKTYAEVRRGHPLSFAAFRQCPWHLYSVLSIEQTQLTMRSPYLDNEFVKTVFRSPACTRGNNQVSMRLVSDGNQELLKLPTDRGIAGSDENVLAMTRRRLLEFFFKAEYAYDMGMPQWMARVDHTLSGLHLERLFLGRHKPFHFRIWYRNMLAGYIREILLDERALSRPYVNRDGLERVVQRHIKGDRNYTNEIHKVLTLELFCRLFLDHAAGAA
jgi:asparagine synthase (glutamine-hydrolysing)